MIVVYWSVHDKRHLYRSEQYETKRAESFGYRLNGYTYKTLSVPVHLAVNKRKRINEELGL